jgi:hypothetical protein
MRSAIQAVGAHVKYHEYLKTKAVYLWRRNLYNHDNTLKELKTEPVTGKKILKYKNNWVQRVIRMQRDRIPKLLKITNRGEEETEDDQ